MFKLLAVAAPVVLGGVYVSGGFGPSEWSREVGRPPAAVTAALADLDVRTQPGAPGTDPARSGGVPSVFRLEQGANVMRWTVMSGDRVATTMIAELQPIAGGTRVVARVERGDAPDDFVAPAFRSEKLTLGLFAMALEGDLSELTMAPKKSDAECAEIFDQIAAANFSGRPEDPQSLKGAMGQTAVTIMKLGQMEAEANRQGCKSRGFDNPAPMQEMMAPAAPSDATYPDPNVPKPGEPMLDPTPPGERRR